jgi:uncharacterized protein (DUF1697 family)
MAQLRKLLAAHGAAHVSTLLASGNILCMPPSNAASFTRLVEKLIAEEFGVTTTAIARTAQQLRAARQAFPFKIHDPKLCAISFLERKPPPAAITALKREDFGQDQCAVIGDALHLRYAHGVHQSKITTARLRRLLGTEGTARNIRTIDALIDQLA